MRVSASSTLEGFGWTAQRPHGTVGTALAASTVDAFHDLVPIRRRALRAASFLNAAEEAADSNAASMTVEEEGKEVLQEARAAETVAKRAVRFAWGAVFICGIGVSIDIIGASLDYRATMRAKEDLDEEEADLEATGWPSWLHQTEA
eukprot:s963_g8.t1